MNSLDTLCPEPRKIAATVCKLTSASMHQIMVYESLKNAQEQEVIGNIQELIDTLSAISQSQPHNDAEL